MAITVDAETARTVGAHLRAELLRCVESDQRLRDELVATGELFGGYHPRMQAVHDSNADILAAIIQTHGWPGRSLVGEDGARAAWLILQHAIARPDLMRGCLPLLTAAAAAGDCAAAYPAYLEDRIRVFEGRPQRYGTSFDWDENGELSPCPLADPQHVDADRTNVGLGPLAEEIELHRARANDAGEQAPADLDRYRARKAEWAVAVGWRPANR